MSDPKPDGEEKERSPWLVAGAVAGLGGEFVAVVIGAFLIGSTVDERFDVGPWGTVGFLAAGMLGSAWHVYLIAKRFLIDEGE